MVSGGKKYTPLDLPNGGYANSRTQSNNMSFAKKAATMNGGRESANCTTTTLLARVQQLTTYTGFRTDSAISGNRFQERERPLQRWVPDESVPDGSLESSNNRSNGGGWNQFKANEQLFGLKTDYDENIYTTVIDRNKPDYPKIAEEADRIAREIESSSTTNRHVAEERITDNLTVDESGLDEEDK